MANDALDPGDGSYPHFPRKVDGTPYWSDTAETDGIGIVVNGVTVAPMPRGLRQQRISKWDRRSVITVDVTPRQPDGSLIDPPVRP